MDPEVEFMNVKSIREIAIGDPVAIEYAVSGESRIAFSIEVEKGIDDSEMAGLSGTAVLNTDAVAPKATAVPSEPETIVN